MKDNVSTHCKHQPLESNLPSPCIISNVYSAGCQHVFSGKDQVKFGYYWNVNHMRFLERSSLFVEGLISSGKRGILVGTNVWIGR
jgi:hypothetical protein